MRPFNLALLGFLILTAQKTLGFVVDGTGIRDEAAEQLPSFGHPSATAAAVAWADALSSPWITYSAIAMIVVGLFLYLVGWPRPALAGDAQALPMRPHHAPVAPPVLSAPAIAATDRVTAALDRLRSMPADTFTAEARTEYEAIRDKHLPGLRSAHSKARAAFPADSREAATLDADLAGSLDLISGKLDELIEDCGDEARTGFDVERRFVQLRHPSEADPLALPSVHMVERGE